MSMFLRKRADGEKDRKKLLKKRPGIKFGPGRTKQAFKDSTDINKMLKKAQVTGSLTHLMKYPEPVYGEFDGEFDLLTAKGQIARADVIFDDLPSEIRSEFDNDSLAFVKFAGDPANNDRLRELLPRLAEPGSFFPNPVNRGATGAGAATPEVIATSENPPPVAVAGTEVPAVD